MEEEGIFYCVEHGEHACKLVLADNKSAHGPIVGRSTLPYRPSLGALGPSEETISRLWFGEEGRSGKEIGRAHG